MERLKILAAAIALREFRADELRAFAGANLDTVRSVLRREANLFEAVATDADGSPGRPAKRYRIKHPERILNEIRELEQELEPAGLWAPQRSERRPEEDRLVATAAAEDAVLDSWSSQEPDERTALARTALAAVGAARRMMPEETVESNAPLRRRTDAVEVFAQMAHAEASGESVGPERLHDAAMALSNLAEVAPERTRQFLLGLSATALRNHQGLPLALALGAHHQPIEAISSIDAQAWVQTDELEDTDYVVWSQRWAAPLAGHRLFAGTVVEDSGEQSIDVPLSRLSLWRGPTVVLSERDDVDLVRQVSELGAFFLPSSAGMGGIARTMVNAFRCVSAQPASMGIEHSFFDYGELDYLS